MSGAQSQKLWRKLHRWVGLSLGVFFVLTAATGTILTFRKQLKAPEPTVPKALQVMPMPPWEAVARAQAHARAQAPGQGDAPTPQPTELYWSTGPTVPWSVVFADTRQTEVYLSPGGAVLDVRHHDQKTFTQWVFALHTGAIAGRAGELAMAVSGLFLCFLVVSGVLIWPWLRRRARS